MDGENLDEARDDSLTVGSSESAAVAAADEGFQSLQITSILDGDQDIPLEMQANRIDDLSPPHYVEGVSEEQEEEEAAAVDDMIENNEEEEFPKLLPHMRCSCHSLNLVATMDVKNALSGPLKRHPFKLSRNYRHSGTNKTGRLARPKL